ncbi:MULTISPECIES: TetR/AcrR family transcriptional regulator [unclassified Sphingobium]|uniref:TetR/AcrR family transcriptional regulator n=1 Tax=unclassified Sphingobium TaxID=2611147 RepID=UPI0015E6B323|nr:MULTISPECIES: TetR/AcrR family transcriptional regulator [unclassified Sphingobium]MBG6120048.1 AcrR family transcriptional regulator [Sphingobium sp. JAI105]
MEDAEVRERRLLNAAREEFLTKGFEGANLDRIAQRSGISKMTVYRQVGSKVALFRKVSMDAVGSLRADYQAAIDEGGPPEKVLRAIIRLSKERSNPSSYAILRLTISQFYNFPEMIEATLQDTIEINEPVADYLLQIGAAATKEEATRRGLILQSMSVGGFLKLIGSEEPNSQSWEDDVLALFLGGISPRIAR